MKSFLESRYAYRVNFFWHLMMNPSLPTAPHHHLSSLLHKSLPPFFTILHDRLTKNSMLILCYNLNTTHVFVRQNTRCPPLHPPYKGPYRNLRRTEKYFVLDYLTHSDRVSIGRLKPVYLSFTNLDSQQLMDPVTNSQSHSQYQTPETEYSNLSPQTYHSITSQGPSHPAHITPLSQQQPRYSTRGRRIQTPYRLRDFCLEKAYCSLV